MFERATVPAPPVVKEYQKRIKKSMRNNKGVLKNG